MGEINDAVNLVKSGARPFKALVTVAEFLEKVGNLENMEREAKARIAAVLKKDSDIAKRSEEANALVDAALLKAATIVDDAKAYAASSTKSAEALAEEILGEAREKAKGLADKAAARKDAVEVEIGRLKAEAAALTLEVNSKGAALGELKAEKAKLLAKLA
jgi:hypothetical protein